MSGKVLSAFPTTFDGPLPPFGPHGGLPQGDYAPGREEFEARFVDTGDTTRRRTIYDGWNRHREALMDAGLSHSARQLLDGSFTTSKRTPGDIDIVVEVPIYNDALHELNADHPVVNLLAGPLMKPVYYCDAYPIYSLPPDHLHHEAVTASAIRYWTKWFGQTRDGLQKGRVWATAGGLL